MDDVINIFYSALNSFFTSSVPLYYPSVSNNPPWFSKELTHLRNKKSFIDFIENSKILVLNLFFLVSS